MPKVGSKKFAYTAKGKAAAKVYAKATGKQLVDMKAAERKLEGTLKKSTKEKKLEKKISKMSGKKYIGKR